MTRIALHWQILAAILLAAFAGWLGGADAGIGSRREMEELIIKAKDVLPVRNIWINPDCGLKTRQWEDVKPALKNMVIAAENLRKKVEVAV